MDPDLAPSEGEQFFMEKMLYYTGKFGVYFSGAAAASLASTKLVDSGLESLAGWGLQQLEDMDLTWMDGFTLSTLDYLGIVNAIIPVEEGVRLYSAYMAAICTILTIRWLKSLIPFWSN